LAAAVALFLAIVIQDRGKREMPAFVLFSPVFWLLVPGSLGLVALTEALTGAPDDSLPKAEGDVVGGAPTDGAGMPTFSDISVSSEGSVLLIFGASIIAITIGMQIASIAGRLVRKLPDLPALPDVKMPGIGR
jgi:ABC-type dipeptide/oligopeptide/nickel transport system permease subunit